MNKIFLETDRTFLRETSPNDTSLLLDLDSDPEVMKYLNDGRPSTPEEVKAAMDRIIKVIEKHHPRFGFWLAYSKENNEFMGWFHFRPGKKTPDDTKNIELGYRLKKKYWGQGFATEVSRALIKLGFEKYKIDSVFAITMKANLSSQNVMKKLGMSFVTEYIEEEFPGKDKIAVRYELKRSAT